jgi:hypothetical protein
LEVMTIIQSIDSGFAITHHGHVEGDPQLLSRPAAAKVSSCNNKL